MQNRLDRLDRYDGVTGSYKDFSVAIIVSDKVVESYQIQVALITAVGLLSRWCSKLSIVVNDCDCLIMRHKKQTVQSALIEVLKEQLSCDVLINKIHSRIDARLIIADKACNEDFWIGFNDWVAGYGYGNGYTPYSGSKTCNPLGASFAACLAVAELFRIANGQEKVLFTKWYSLIDFEDATNPDTLKNDLSFPINFNIGNILQIGSGAVGSNFLFFLSLTDWIAKIDLVDFDPVSLENCPNSLIFNESHEDQLKVSVCHQALSNNSLTITPFDSDYEKYKQHSDILKVPDIVLCFANERNIWEDVQYNLPPLCFHATTNKNWGINFGRHIPLKEWCVVCRFERNSDKPKDPVFGCSTGVIKDESNGKEIIGMLPFLSAASAILVLTDLSKLTTSGFPINHNFTEFSFKSRTGMFLNIPNGKKPCYVCETQPMTLYKKFRSETKYWWLSE